MDLTLSDGITGLPLNTTLPPLFWQKLLTQSGKSDPPATHVLRLFFRLQKRLLFLKKQPTASNLKKKMHSYTELAGILYISITKHKKRIKSSTKRDTHLKGKQVQYMWIPEKPYISKSVI
jgi:hypothetical protein